MTYWETARRWLMRLCFGGVLFLLASCGGPGGEECGGVDTLVSCVTVTDIEPIQDGLETRDVDVTFNPDCDGDPTTNDPEPFTRHDATVTFANRTFPTADSGLPVTIHRVVIAYSVITCPAGAICPPLTAFTQNVSLTIPADGVSSSDFPLVPISTKNEFITQGGTASAFPTYNATYTFTGTTDFFEDTLNLQGSTSFVLGSFNNCT